MERCCNHTVPEQRFKRWPAYFQELGYEVVAIGKVAHYGRYRQYSFDHCSHFKYHQDECIDEAIAWLEKRTSRKPLCLFVESNWPHVPWPEKHNYQPEKLPCRRRSWIRRGHGSSAHGMQRRWKMRTGTWGRFMMR